MTLHMPAQRRTDLWFAVVLTAFSLVVAVESWRMPRLAELGVNPMSAPGLTPGLLALVLVVLGIALLWRSLRAPTAPDDTATVVEGAADDPPARATWPRALLALLLCLVYALGLLGRLPFMWATGLFVFAFIAAFSFDRARPMRALGGALLMAVAVAASVSLLFEQLFLVRLP
ncbi:MAG: tripartite tricarboxylate transporter TctB family protein [Proteobacteria bacterium]|nr:tripartite tricarboxylate transporter TctB family protein [Pseudomonadota bacterium]